MRYVMRYPRCRKYADSKTLTEEKRSILSAQVKAEPNMAWAVNSLNAEYLSNSMLQRGRISLNEIAAQATFSLIRLFQQQGMNIVKVCRAPVHIQPFSQCIW